MTSRRPPRSYANNGNPDAASPELIKRRLRDAAASLVAAASDYTSPRQIVALANELDARTDRIREGKD